MECERGTVDGPVLDFLAGSKLTAGDLIRVSDGSCRLHPQLSQAVVAACRVGQTEVDAHARWLRERLEALREAYGLPGSPPPARPAREPAQLSLAW